MYIYTLATKNIKSSVCYLEQVSLLYFSNTHELWSSKANWCLHFSLLSIILADLLGKRTLHKQVQKVMVCDLYMWLVDFDPFCGFLCCRICCLWSLLWLPTAKNAIVKMWPLSFRVCVFVKSAVNWAHATVQAYSVWLYVTVFSKAILIFINSVLIHIVLLYPVFS